MGQGCCGGGNKEKTTSEENFQSGMSGGCCGSKNSSPISNMANSNSCSTSSLLMEMEGNDETKVIEITPSAIFAIKSAIEEEGEAGDGLRVSVVGGGCSGYQYNLDFDKESRMGDTVLSFDNVSIFIDPISASYLKGTTIDYVSGLNGTGFKFENPNAKRTCGCGSSFS